ncbi:GntR family transcriptional regulator [Antarctobacter heliothermus]|uniref:DNA-binding transcriptional regulator, GntR family n=1 Tax=Antarctobacter heliothermus TaxID=74033 RepID=A0A239FUU9_9RHOB|nr:GntR family transcriptional regulator [Antarctobacter heliothermus]SNS60936.1 DNA-binding transcriptional regulator, GntR family [Antarctobacter heliothermus]
MKLREDTEDTPLYEAILSEIYLGRLADGQRLKVSELANRFGVSTSPVREVLRRMQGEGFVQIHPNKGATVRPTDAGFIQNVFEVLQMLEPYFVTWFADYAPDEHIDELEAIQKKIHATSHSEQLEFRKLDFQFHNIFCRNHYNQTAAEIWRNLRTSLNVQAARLRISPARFETIKEEHDELIAACRAHDAAQAHLVIRKHADGSFVQMSQQIRALGLSANRLSRAP